MEYLRIMNDLRMSTGVFTTYYSGFVEDPAKALEKFFRFLWKRVSDWTTKTLRRQNCLIDLLSEVPSNIT